MFLGYREIWTIYLFLGYRNLFERDIFLSNTKSFINKLVKTGIFKTFLENSKDKLYKVKNGQYLVLLFINNALINDV
tara:strand:- start:276 stop:506 length:231 start_codon:yes stop_codon:yes gene_type:complete